MVYENKKFISEFKVLEHKRMNISRGICATASLWAQKIEPIFNSNTPVGDIVGSNFLYDDYVPCLHEGETFWEILRLEVSGNDSRRHGLGTEIVKKFIDEVNPTSVILRAGVLYEDIYNYLDRNGLLMDYIPENIVPFWETLDFTNMNGTTFELGSTVPMLWPKTKAAEVFQFSNDRLI